MGQKQIDLAQVRDAALAAVLAGFGDDAGPRKRASGAKVGKSKQDP